MPIWTEADVMATTRHWTVDIYLSEKAVDDPDGGGTAMTHAEARLRTDDTTGPGGRGAARKHPADPDVPEIGDELAAARALSDLAHQLLHAAAEDIEAVIGKSTAGQPAASWVDPAR
ncbi:DUF1876 domain-containing protein [Embleya sp. NPDC050154]|uniref:DUF1876 domain-containing protein n=1 Tax=Embleya sp. NPDC050154 TaxID=3363988 RepID=UPI003787C648